MEQSNQNSTLQLSSLLSSEIAKPAKLINDMVLQGEMSLDKAVNGHQVSTYRNEFGFQQIQLVITIWLLDMAASFNIKNNLNETQAADIAAKIIRDHWYLKLASIRLFCEKCKDGYFGQNYQTIDRLTVLGWLEKFEGEIDEYFIEKNDKKPEIDQVQLPDTILTALKSAIKTIPNKQTLQEKLQDPEYKKFYMKREFEQRKKEAADGTKE